ncbi:PTS transporter subunit EIIC [Atopobium sp. oral taxon 416]|uniref:PTS transporter subunit EIIC n=1 Tax=Atopobium sp. oral taxon 416 TaxID=712157 RepID=UPI001BAD98EA|nr:PTS transporter subunit EIIC [Atopobium sp. oral taxon 416]QUC02500.1 PTS transporter subunit EIIC [Atopobium sp. oral taxon 416]
MATSQDAAVKQKRSALGVMKLFSGAIIQPIVFLSVVGIVLAVCVILRLSFMPAVIQTIGTFFFNVFLPAGISNLPVIIMIGLSVAFAHKKKTDAAVVSILTFLVYLYANNTFLKMTGRLIQADTLAGTGQGMALGLQVNDTGVFAGIIIGCLTGWIFNRTCDTQFPEALRIYGGSRFSAFCCMMMAIAFGIVVSYVWPFVNKGISALSTLIEDSGLFGVFVYGFLNRFLIPTGLHHLVYMPFMYSAIGGTATIAGQTYEGAVPIYTAELGNASTITSIDPSVKYGLFGFSKIWGSIGSVLAFIHCARPERKDDVKAMMLPAMGVALLAGITEPLEFLYLFASPLLWLVHSLLDGLGQMLEFALGFRLMAAGGILDIIPGLIALPAEMTKWYVFFIIGVIFIAVWYFSFVFLIQKLDLHVPGREENYVATGTGAVKNVKGVASMGDVQDIIDGLGGKSNIKAVINCMTRLRVDVYDISKVDKDKINRFKNSGIVMKKDNVQIIIGLKVDDVCEAINQKLGAITE